jgi:hypothetical protein
VPVSVVLVVEFEQESETVSGMKDAPAKGKPGTDFAARKFGSLGTFDVRGQSRLGGFHGRRL